MTINTYVFFLLTVGLLFSLFGCGNGGNNLPHHPDMFREMTDTLIGETKENPDAQASFEQNLLPILTARCALAGCHVADGPYGLDFRTYQSFIAGGSRVFSPGNARSSDIVEEIVSGRMPPGGPRLSDDQIQLFVNWINQQAPTAGNQRHDDDDDDDYPDGYRDDDDDDDDYPDGYRDDDDDDDYPDGYRDDDDDDDDDHDDDDHDDDDDDHDDDDDDHDDD